MVSKQRSIWVLAALSSACGGATDTGSEGAEGSREESAVCAARDEGLLEPHAAWQGSDNSFGELAGTRWVGIFGQPGNSQKALDIELELASLAEGTLQVGPRVEAPDKDGSMLDYPPDGSLVEPLYYSGTYELRGAAFSDGELTAFIPLNAAFEDWCAQQTSYLQTPGVPDYCEFYTFPSETLVIGINGSSCHFEPSQKVVDCAWYQQSSEHCVCTSSQCFANVVLPVLREWETFEDYAAEGVALRLTLDEEQNLLIGVGVWQDAEYYLELTRVLD